MSWKVWELSWKVWEFHTGQQIICERGIPHPPPKDGQRWAVKVKWQMYLTQNLSISLVWENGLYFSEKWEFGSKNLVRALWVTQTETVWYTQCLFPCPTSRLPVHLMHNVHRMLTLEKKSIPPLLPGLKSTTFLSQVQHSNHWAIPAAPVHVKHVMGVSLLTTWQLSVDRDWMLYSTVTLLLGWLCCS